MAGYRKPRAPYAGMGARYLPAAAPPPRRAPTFLTPPGVMGAGFQGGHPFAAPVPPGGQPHAHAGYTMADYLRSLGYSNQQAYLHSLGLDAPSYTPLSDTDAQTKAKAFVDSQLGPLLDRLNRDYADRTKLGSQAIQSLTTMLAGLAGQYGPQQGAAYNEAISQDKALAGDLADRLTGAGQSQGAELGAKLAQAGQDTGGAQDIVGVGSGAANAGFAKDTAALEALVANSAAAQEFGAKLPLIEGLTGVQAGQQYQSDLLGALGQDTASVTGQAPALIQNYLANLYSQDSAARGSYETAKTNRAQAQLGLGQDYVAARDRRQTNAINQQRYNTQQRQQAASTAENQRRYQESVSEHRGEVAHRAKVEAVAAAQRRAGIVARDAPTVRGRQAYWDSVAAQRTRDKGVVYTGTATGIKPVIDPKTGQPQLTSSESAQRRQEKERKREFNVSAEAAGIKTTVQADTAAAKLAQSAAKEAHRHAETLKRISAEIDSTTERIRHNKSIEANEKASTAARASATRARVADEKRRAALTQSQQAETERHHRAQEAGKTGKADVREPIRVGPGKWQTRTGRPLGPKGNAYWEKKFQGGFTDGRGHRRAGKAGSGGGGSGYGG